MPTESMKYRKREATSYHSDYEDYENGKPQDKAQKKLGDFE